ncbi:MAG: hypothetical protein E7456_02775 [Ruminococcaceae bacterium]|nr:hypothetical protein [Oscillospiraceae bacterium]
MFVKNNTTGKYYIDGTEVTAGEYEIRLSDFWANFVPEEPEADPEITDSEALEILMGGAV